MSKPIRTVGYIGLGIMGKPMALNILNKGFEMHVWARRAESMQPLLDAGATAHNNPAELARAVDTVFINVSDTPDVEAVILGKHGVIEGAHNDLLVVDNSTICPDATRAIAEKLQSAGVEFMDAPVSGGDVGAQAGTLSVMVGGSAAAFNRIHPVLETIGTNIVHIGDVGAGQTCKACNQVLVAQSMSAVGEALMLAQALGVDGAKVREALLGGFAQSRILDIHGQRVLDKNFAPGFKAELHNKDMNIALNAAKERNLHLPGASVSAKHIQALVDAGLGENDSSAQCKIIAQQSGLDWFD